MPAHVRFGVADPGMRAALVLIQDVVVVTGTSDLAMASGADLFRVAAVLFFAGLFLAWLAVIVRTAAGTWSGRLLRA